MESKNKIAPFKLERYFAKYEFTAQYLLSPSDCESLSMKDILQMADENERKMWEGLSLGYTESAGHPLLRERISGLYSSCNPEQVLVVAPEEGIFILMNTLLNPEDHVIALTPAYQSLYEVSQSMGCRVSLWWLKLKNGRWQMDLDELQRIITPRTRLLVVNFPHNPTGFLPAREEFNCLVEIARTHGIYLFCDEMYRFLEYDSASHLPAVCDTYEKGISLSGMSKTFAMPGLRIGWLVTQDAELYRDWRVFKDYTTICSSAPAELLSMIALRNAERIAQRSRSIVLQNLAVADAFFASHTDLFEWIPPVAGSIAFPRLILDLSVEKFCEDVVQQKSVMITPGSLFDFPGNHFRIGLGRKNFPEALHLVENHLQENLLA